MILIEVKIPKGMISRPHKEELARRLVTDFLTTEDAVPALLESSRA